MQGYLDKQSTAQTNVWQRRFFVLETDKARVMYYKKESHHRQGKPAHGKISLRHMTRCWVPQTQKPGASGKVVFHVHTGKRISFRAALIQEAQGWVLALSPFCSEANTAPIASTPSSIPTPTSPHLSTSISTSSSSSVHDKPNSQNDDDNKYVTNNTHRYDVANRFRFTPSLPCHLVGFPQLKAVLVERKILPLVLIIFSCLDTKNRAAAAGTCSMFRVVVDTMGLVENSEHSENEQEEDEYDPEQTILVERKVGYDPQGDQTIIVERRVMGDLLEEEGEDEEQAQGEGYGKGSWASKGFHVLSPANPAENWGVSAAQRAAAGVSKKNRRQSLTEEQENHALQVAVKIAKNQSSAPTASSVLTKSREEDSDDASSSDSDSEPRILPPQPTLALALSAAQACLTANPSPCPKHTAQACLTALALALAQLKHASQPTLAIALSTGSSLPHSPSPCPKHSSSLLKPASQPTLAFALSTAQASLTALALALSTAQACLTALALALALKLKPASQPTLALALSTAQANLTANPSHRPKHRLKPASQPTLALALSTAQACLTALALALSQKKFLFLNTRRLSQSARAVKKNKLAPSSLYSKNIPVFQHSPAAHVKQADRHSGSPLLTITPGANSFVQSTQFTPPFAATDPDAIKLNNTAANSNNHNSSTKLSTNAIDDDDTETTDSTLPSTVPAIASFQIDHNQARPPARGKGLGDRVASLGGRVASLSHRVNLSSRSGWSRPSSSVHKTEENAGKQKESNKHADVVSPAGQRDYPITAPAAPPEEWGFYLRKRSHANRHLWQTRFFMYKPADSRLKTRPCLSWYFSDKQAGLKGSAPSGAPKGVLFFDQIRSVRRPKRGKGSENGCRLDVLLLSKAMHIICLDPETAKIVAGTILFFIPTRLSADSQLLQNSARSESELTSSEQSDSKTSMPSKKQGASSEASTPIQGMLYVRKKALTRARSRRGDKPGSKECTVIWPRYLVAMERPPGSHVPVLRYYKSEKNKNIRGIWEGELPLEFLSARRDIT
eukprot:g59044.t1